MTSNSRFTIFQHRPIFSFSLFRDTTAPIRVYGKAPSARLRRERRQTEPPLEPKVAHVLDSWSERAFVARRDSVQNARKSRVQLSSAGFGVANEPAAARSSRPRLAASSRPVGACLVSASPRACAAWRPNVLLRSLLLSLSFSLWICSLGSTYVSRIHRRPPSEVTRQHRTPETRSKCLCFTSRRS